jgi:hypothetical protein
MRHTIHRVRGAVLAGAVAALCGAAMASSHREAPFITEIPKVDGTDFYMFNSYEQGRDGYVTLVANYLPLQNPYGGPNYFQLDPDALYQIHIDNNGDAREDLTFEFRFKNTLRGISLNVGGQMVPIPLIQAGQISAGNTGALNVLESYSVNVVRGDQFLGDRFPVTNAMTGGDVFAKPVDNIGNKTIPDYNAYANSHIYEINLPGSSLRGRMFVGQRKDPFVVNLGETFDLVNTNPLGPENGESDDLFDSNITSLILEIPAAYLRSGNETVVGGWTTASLHRGRALSGSPTFLKPASETGSWVLVSRLGMPLVNELVIGLPDKNKFNNTRPRHDAQFATYVTNPTLPALLAILFPVQAPCLPRNDLVDVFLLGLPGLNRPAGVVGSEMLRLNTNTDPLSGGIPAKPKGQQSRLGALGGDLAGFPNGRRPGDDVVDIELRVVIGALIPNAGQPGSCAPNGDLALTDGAFLDDSYFLDQFPYLINPLPGSPN